MDPDGADTGTSTAMDHGTAVARLTATEGGVAMTERHDDKLGRPRQSCLTIADAKMPKMDGPEFFYGSA
jgi:CheY-like chemotaxis protein